MDNKQAESSSQQTPKPQIVSNAIQIDLSKYKQQPSQQPESTTPIGQRKPPQNIQFHQQERELSEQEKQQREREYEYLRKKQKAFESPTFSYLDIFDKQMKAHQQAQDEFYQAQQKEESDIDSKRPALFRADTEDQTPKPQNPIIGDEFNVDPNATHSPKPIDPPNIPPHIMKDVQKWQLNTAATKQHKYCAQLCIDFTKGKKLSNNEAQCMHTCFSKYEQAYQHFIFEKNLFYKNLEDLTLRGIDKYEARNI